MRRQTRRPTGPRPLASTATNVHSVLVNAERAVGRSERGRTEYVSTFPQMVESKTEQVCCASFQRRSDLRWAIREKNDSSSASTLTCWELAPSVVRPSKEKEKVCPPVRTKKSLTIGSHPKICRSRWLKNLSHGCHFGFAVTDVQSRNPFRLGVVEHPTPRTRLLRLETWNFQLVLPTFGWAEEC